MNRIILLARSPVRSLIPQAYLESNEEVIREHCSPEMIERLTGIMRAQKQQVRRRWPGSACTSTLWPADLPACPRTC